MSFDPPDYKEPVCPECGEVCEKIYKDNFGFVIGCDVCLTEYSADECDECFEEDEGHFPN